MKTANQIIEIIEKEIEERRVEIIRQTKALEKTLKKDMEAATVPVIRNYMQARTRTIWTLSAEMHALTGLLKQI